MHIIEFLNSIVSLVPIMLRSFEPPGSFGPYELMKQVRNKAQLFLKVYFQLSNSTNIMPSNWKVVKYLKFMTLFRRVWYLSFRDITLTRSCLCPKTPLSAAKKNMSPIILKVLSSRRISVAHYLLLLQLVLVAIFGEHAGVSTGIVITQ